MIRKGIVAFASVLTLVLGGLFGTALPTVAVTANTWVATPNGINGLQQTVTVRAPRATLSVVTITFENASVGTNAGQATVDATGFAYLPWTPDVPGKWAITARAEGRVLGEATIDVDAMPTITTLVVPGSVQANRRASLPIEVRAVSGEVIPSGTVTVKDQDGDIVASGTLSPTETKGLATANVSWEASPGTTRLTARYAPASAAFAPSVSTAQTPVIGAAQPVALQLPPVFYVGVPAEVAGIIAPSFRSPLGGSVAFSLNNQGFVSYPMGGSKPIGSGMGTATWTPTQPGVQAIRVEYASANFGINGNATQVINVQPAPEPDAITLGPVGGNPWTAGVPQTAAAGTTIALETTSQSKNPVAISTDGPCVAVSQLVTLLAPGNCTIAASSLGNGGSLNPATSTYAVSISD